MLTKERRRVKQVARDDSPCALQLFLSFYRAALYTQRHPANTLRKPLPFSYQLIPLIFPKASVCEMLKECQTNRHDISSRKTQEQMWGKEPALTRSTAVQTDPTSSFLRPVFRFIIRTRPGCKQERIPELNQCEDKA